MDKRWRRRVVARVGEALARVAGVPDKAAITHERRQLALWRGLGGEVPRSTIQNWLAGKTIPDSDNAIMLGRVSGMSVDYLLGFENVPTDREGRVVTSDLALAMHEHLRLTIARELGRSSGEVVTVLPNATTLLREVGARYADHVRQALVEKRRAWKRGTLAALDEELAELGSSEPYTEFHLLRERQLVDRMPDFDAPTPPELRQRARDAAEHVRTATDAGHQAQIDANIDATIGRLRGLIPEADLTGAAFRRPRGGRAKPRSRKTMTALPPESVKDADIPYEKPPKVAQRSRRCRN